jgi:hypothetical protein
VLRALFLYAPTVTSTLGVPGHLKFMYSFHFFLKPTRGANSRTHLILYDAWAYIQCKNNREDDKTSCLCRFETISLPLGPY